MPYAQVQAIRLTDFNYYGKQELHAAFAAAGFSQVDFRSFPGLYSYLNVWGHIVVARP